VDDPADTRTTALQLACRVVPVGDPPGHFLSTARQFETYLVTGLSQTGPRNQQGTQVGRDGLSVLVDAEGLTSELVTRLRIAVAGVL